MAVIKITPADHAFSLCVRERSNWTCERCGKKYDPPTQALHCCHYYSRGNWSVRFDPANAAAMCMGCHLLTSRERETEHRPLMAKIVGELELDRLAFDKARPANGIRRRVAEIAKHYREQYKQMQELRKAGVIGRIEFEGWQG